MLGATCGGKFGQESGVVANNKNDRRVETDSGLSLALMILHCTLSVRLNYNTEQRPPLVPVMPGKKKILPNFRLVVIVQRGLGWVSHHHSALTFKYKPTTWFLNSHVRKVLFTIQTWDFPYIHTMFIFLSNISRRTPHCCKSVFLFIFCNMVMCDYQPGEPEGYLWWNTNCFITTSTPDMNVCGKY